MNKQISDLTGLVLALTEKLSPLLMKGTIRVQRQTRPVHVPTTGPLYSCKLKRRLQEKARVNMVSELFETCSRNVLENVKKTMELCLCNCIFDKN